MGEERHSDGREARGALGLGVKFTRWAVFVCWTWNPWQGMGETRLWLPGYLRGLGPLGDESALPRDTEQFEGMNW